MKLTSRLTPIRRNPLGALATSLLLSVGWMMTGTFAIAQSMEREKLTESVTPLEIPSSTITGEELFEKLIEHNQLRDIHLEHYSATRTYKVTNPEGKVYAEETVSVAYHAPNHKSFAVTQESGSWLVRNSVLKRLRDSESETSSGQAHRDSSIKPDNYSFNLIGEEDAGPHHCFVVEAIPKRKDKYLFEGNIWIDSQDYAIVKIAGHPAKSPSFWLNRVDFVRQYQKIGEFWVPAKDETVVHVRLYGKKILTIDHQNYVINKGDATDGQDQSFVGQSQESQREQ
jgi:outer membrane lipoprotein-sorting protein